MSWIDRAVFVLSCRHGSWDCGTPLDTSWWESCVWWHHHHPYFCSDFCLKHLTSHTVTQSMLWTCKRGHTWKTLHITHTHKDAQNSIFSKTSWWAVWMTRRFLKTLYNSTSVYRRCLPDSEQIHFFAVQTGCLEKHFQSVLTWHSTTTSWITEQIIFFLFRESWIYSGDM